MREANEMSCRGRTCYDRRQAVTTAATSRGLPLIFTLEQIYEYEMAVYQQAILMKYSDFLTHIKNGPKEST